MKYSPPTFYLAFVIGTAVPFGKRGDASKDSAKKYRTVNNFNAAGGINAATLMHFRGDKMVEAAGIEPASKGCDQ